MRSFIIFVVCTLFGFSEGYAQNGCKPQLGLGSTISFCQGNSITLSAYNPNSTYIWSTGATTPNITVNTSGIYWVVATNACGSSTDTVEIIADPVLTINLGSDRAFCSGFSDTLYAPYSSSYSYNWNTGATGSFIVVNQPGTYWVTVINACDTYSDTINLSTESPPVIDLGPDIICCNSNPVTLTCPPNTNCLWSTGSNSSQISVSTPGQYWLAATNSCGTFSDTISIDFQGNVQLNLPDTLLLCPGGSLNITAQGGSSGTYNWSNGASTATVTISNAGLYSVQYTNACGTFYDSTYVKNNPNPTLNLGADTTICENSNFLLDAQNQGATYLWNTGETSQTIQPQSTGNYWVKVNNGCNTLTDSIYIEVLTLPNPNIEPQSRICLGTPLLIDAGNWGPNTTYAWSHGPNTRTAAFSNPGSYSVTVSNQCGTTTTNFTLYDDQPADFSLGADDTILCKNNFYLTPDIFIGEGDTLLWSTGSSNDSILASSSGIYWLKITNACGVYTDTIHLTLQKKPKKALQDSVSLCNGGSATLKIPFIDNTFYNWSTGDTTNIISVNTPGTYTYSAYNYCDTVTGSIVVTTVYPIAVNLGSDTTICQPAIHLLDVSMYQSDSVVWSTGSRNSILPVNTSGTYWVKVYNACGVYNDTITVTVNLLPSKKLTNTSVCNGQSTTFDASQNIPVNYLWNTGSTSPAISVSQEGWYTVSLTNNCGTVIDSAYLNVDSIIPPINLGDDTIFCQGTLTLNPGFFNGANYLWQDGSKNSTFTVTQSGLYYVTVSNACNSVKDSIDILITGPPSLTLGNIVKFCSGNTLTLNAQNPGSTYLWNTGDTTQTLDVTTAGKYWVTITNNCGSLTDTVEAVVELPMFNLNIGEDTIICNGQNLLLDTKYPGVKTTWQDGSTMQTFTVTKTGLYHVKVSNTCGVWMDSIFVEVQDIPEFSLGNDTAICAIDGALTLSAPEGYNSYLWSTGDTTSDIVVNQHGFYYLTVFNKCFSYTDTIEVIPEYPIIVDLGPDTILCFGDSYQLNTNISNYPVYWSSGFTGMQREITTSGTYIASVNNACGTFSDTVNIKFDLPIDQLNIDTTICANDTLMLNLTHLPHNIIWDDGDTAKTKSFINESVYGFTISNKCGDFPAQLSVDLSNCDCPFFTANAFTPNGDLLNDEFLVKHSCDLTIFRLQIFNRWGEMIFETDQADDGWDGTFKGEDAPTGVYLYHIYYSWDVYHLDRHRKHAGELVLLR